MITAADILRDLEAHMYRVVVASHPEKTALACVQALVDCLCLNFKNQALYVPTPNYTEANQRYDAIWRDFTGNNHAELAIKYKLSLTRVYIIINLQRAKGVRARQADIFPLPEETDDRPLALIVFEDYLPPDLVRAGLPEAEAMAAAMAMYRRLISQFPGIQVRALAKYAKRRQRADTVDLFNTDNKTSPSQSEAI